MLVAVGAHRCVGVCARRGWRGGADNVPPVGGGLAGRQNSCGGAHKTYHEQPDTSIVAVGVYPVC